MDFYNNKKLYIFEPNNILLIKKLRILRKRILIETIRYVIPDRYDKVNSVNFQWAIAEKQKFYKIKFKTTKNTKKVKKTKNPKKSLKSIKNTACGPANIAPKKIILYKNTIKMLKRTHMKPKYFKITSKTKQSSSKNVSSHFLRKGTDKLRLILRKIQRFTISQKKIKNRRKRSENGNINKTMKIMQWNKGNSFLRNKIEDIKDIIRKHKPEVLVINEVHLNMDDDQTILNIKGYRVETDSLMESQKTIRTMILIKDNINYTRLKKYEAKDESAVTISIGFYRHKRIILTGYYRQWQLPCNTQPRKITEQNERFKVQAELWGDMIDQNLGKEIHFLGDFNINAKIWAKNENEKKGNEKIYNTMSNLIKENILDKGFKLINSLSTRRMGGSESLLDHYYTNKPSKIKSIQQIDDTSSDHSILIICRQMNITEAEEKYILTRNYSKINFEMVENEILDREEYFEVFESEDPHKISEKIISLINSALDNQSKIQKVKIPKHEEKYFSQKVEELLHRKKIVYEKVKNFNKNEDKNELKNLKWLIKNVRKEEEAKMSKSEFEKCNKDPSKMWKTAQKQVFKIESHPERIIENGKIVVGSKAVAEALNRFYVSKIRKLREGLKKNRVDPMVSYQKYVKTPNKKLKIQQINMSDLHKIFRSMKKSNSTSVDMISMKTLSKIKFSTMPLILHLINTIIKTETFPNNLKTSRIVPIKKCNDLDDLDMAKFRPVNLLSPIAKLVEKVWYTQIFKHLTDNKMIDENLQGGIRGRSSNLTLAEIYQKLSRNKAMKVNSALITMDLSSAFEIVPHRILKLKLLHLGIEEGTVRMIMSYLHDRKQVVTVNGNTSQTLLTGPVSVCQGSVLSSLLWIIYTLDLHNQPHRVKHNNHLEYSRCNRTNMCVYIDDSYSIVRETGKGLWEDVRSQIKLMENYFNSNELFVNVKKTVVMLITNSRELKNANIEIEGKIINHSRTMKILGSILNDELKWSDHFLKGEKALITNLRRRAALIKRMIFKMGRHFSTTFATAILMGKLSYHCEIIGNTSKTIKNKVDDIILSTAKAILGVKAIGRTKKWILNYLNWQDYNQLTISAIQKLSHKMINVENDHYIRYHITENRSVRNFAQNKLSHHRPGIGLTEAEQRSFEYLSVKYFNILPRELTLIRKNHLFKKYLRKYNIDRTVKLKPIEDNTIEILSPNIDQNNIDRCEEDQ